jgi:nucleotide-binding universal stress UspA family protein
MFERVLLCYDDSPLGRKALRRGAELAVILKTQVFVLCVVPATAPNATMVAAAAGTVCLVDPDAAYRESLAESLEALHALGLEGEGHLARGTPLMSSPHLPGSSRSISSWWGITRPPRAAGGPVRSALRWPNV